MVDMNCIMGNSSRVPGDPNAFSNQQTRILITNIM